MGALLGLLLGAGLVLVWLAATGDGWRRDRPAEESRLRALLQRAGVEGVTPSGVVLLSLAGAALTGVVMLAVSQTVPVALVSPSWVATCRPPCSRAEPSVGNASSPSCGRRRSTTWRRPCGPACPCRRP